MDWSRLSRGEVIATASGVALLIVMFLPWYGWDIGLGPDNFSAWAALGFIDVLLFLIAALAIALGVARAAGVMPVDLPAPPGTIVAAAGVLAALLVLYRLLDLPGPDLGGADVDVNRKLGVYLGLLSSAGIAFGGFRAARERSSVTSRRAPRL